MGSVGIGELVLMLLAAVIAVGPDRLPEFARNVARMIRTVRGVAQDLTLELRREVGVDEVSELFRAHGFDEVKPTLTISGSLPPPVAVPTRPGAAPPTDASRQPPADAAAAPAGPDSPPPTAPEV
ncbi:MAG: hypothetical protein AUI14_20225 [Actinobacteria bacterium 13_2_20CM_2_71_6]|nr:MAG: hypothetical protein AUI14_20225 [Actinobacteria bacterium 13_2_20CM_2_71_6]